MTCVNAIHSGGGAKGYDSGPMTDAQTITLRPPVWALLAAVIIGGSFFVYGKTVETRDHSPTIITVSGEGKEYGSPDIAMLSFGVQTGRRSTAKEAMDVLQKTMTAVFQAVQKEGVQTKDTQSESFSLSPAYDWTNGRQILGGYEASQTLSVKVRDLDKVSAVLGAATNAGANQAGDVNFAIDNPEKVRATAREKAITQAQEKAATLATQLHMSLGKIKGFMEDSAGQGPLPMMKRVMLDSSAAGAGAAPSLPLPAGQQEVDVQVSLTYELR